MNHHSRRKTTSHVDRKSIMKLAVGCLDPEEKLSVESHLNQCDSCNRHFERSKETLRALDSWSVNSMKKLVGFTSKVVISGLGLAGIESAGKIARMDRKITLVTESEIILGELPDDLEYLLLVIDASYLAVDGKYFEKVAAARRAGAKVLTLVFASRDGLTSDEEMRRLLLAFGGVSEKLIVTAGFPSTKRSAQEASLLAIELLRQLSSKANLTVSGGEIHHLSAAPTYAVVERIESVINPLSLAKIIGASVPKWRARSSAKTVSVVFRTSRLSLLEDLDISALEKKLKKMGFRCSITARVESEMPDRIPGATILIGTERVEDLMVPLRAARYSTPSKRPAYWLTGLGMAAAILIFVLSIGSRELENYRRQLTERLDALRSVINKSYEISSAQMGFYSSDLHFDGRYLMGLSKSNSIWRSWLSYCEVQIGYASSMKELSMVERMLENIEWQFWDEVLRNISETPPDNTLN